MDNLTNDLESSLTFFIDPMKYNIKLINSKDLKD